MVREMKTQASYLPHLSKNGGIKGYLQCMIIDSHGGTYNNTLKAIPLEKPSQDQATSVTPNEQRDIKCYIKKDVNKEISFSLSDIPNGQKSRDYYLECIEVLFKECSKSGGMY